MITESDIVTKVLNRQYVDLARREAIAAELGGSSNIREKDDRMAALSEDQLIGQIATLAFHMYWYGHPQFYIQERAMQNKFKSQGDGGSDLSGANLDVKGSKRRYPQKPILEHRLLVRPRELKGDTVYVMALVELKDDGTAVVMFTGWAKGSELEQPTDDKFGDARQKEAKNLKPLPPIHFSWL